MHYRPECMNSNIDIMNSDKPGRLRSYYFLEAPLCLGIHGIIESLCLDNNDKKA
jgi:hypothetical protein